MNKISISLAILIILTIPVTSAGIADWFESKLTGKASSQPTDVVITVRGTAPIIIEQILSQPYYSPIEGTTSDINFNVIASDPDGVNDIDDTSITAQITKDLISQDTSCTHVNDIDKNKANYTCKVTLDYYNLPGYWNISASGTDLGNKTIITNDSGLFLYSELKSMTAEPNLITWAEVSSGGTDQKAATVTTINNTGNYNGPISLLSYDLVGDSDNTQRIFAANMSSGIQDDCLGTKLENNITKEIVGSAANPGNLLLGDGSGQEELYYCVNNVPQISSQTYSSTSLGAWIISY